MRIACTIANGRGGTDDLLASFAQVLQERGQRIGGTVQFNTAPCDDRKCDMDVRVLPDGPVIRISQSLGAGARGCRLDPGALEQAVGLVAERLAAGTDLLIVNKFGKHEAEGRGFRPLIAEAIGRDIPVLVGLNTLNRPAFDAFSGGMAEQLDATIPALLTWFENVVVAA